jgi:hypothetical protein
MGRNAHFDKGILAMTEFGEDIKAGVKNAIAPLKGFKRYLLIALGIGLVVLGWNILPAWALIVAGGLMGFLLGPVVILAISPLYKEQLKHNPNSKRIGLFIEVQQGRSVVIVKGGKPLYVVEGGRHAPERKEAKFLLWYWYQSYIFYMTGLHAYVPFFTVPHVYGVPRWTLNRHGVQGYKLIGEGDDGFWSNHVRTEPTTWHFVFTGVDIQKVSFTIKGSAVIRIVPDMEIDALFDIDSWSELLNQALESTIRNYMRANVSLDTILGSVSKELWAESEKSMHMDDIAQKIKDLLREFKVSNHGLKKAKEGEDVELDEKGEVKRVFDLESSRKLIEFGIDIQRVDLRDFECESEAERAKFTAAATGREEGRRRSLEGQGIAEAEEKLLGVHDGSEASLEIIKQRGFVDAVRGSNVIDTAIGAFAKKQIGDR